MLLGLRPSVVLGSVLVVARASHVAILTGYQARPPPSRPAPVETISDRQGLDIGAEEKAPARRCRQPEHLPRRINANRRLSEVGEQLAGAEPRSRTHPGPTSERNFDGDLERAGARAVPTAAPVLRALVVGIDGLPMHVRTVSRDWECLGQVADRDHQTAWCSQLSPRRSVWGTPAARCESRCPFLTSSGPLLPHLQAVRLLLLVGVRSEYE